jgi:hypothetical protein
LDHALTRKVLFFIKILSQFRGKNFNGLLLLLLCFLFSIYGKQTKKEIRTPSTDAWEGKAKEEKLSHTLLTGIEKKTLKRSAQL